MVNLWMTLTFPQFLTSFWNLKGRLDNIYTNTILIESWSNNLALIQIHLLSAEMAQVQITVQ